MLWRFAFLALIGVGAFAFTERNPEFLSNPDAVGHVVYLFLILAAVLFLWDLSPGAQPGGVSPMGAAKRLAATVIAWVAIFAGLILAYDYRDELRSGALRMLSALQPGHPIEMDGGEIILTRDRDGHFSARAEVNGQRLRMLVDTGASDIALPYEAAERLGLDIDGLVFDRLVMTANGDATVAAVTLDEVSIGSLRLNDVDASIAAPGRLSGALLGMSFLGRLSEFTFRGDKLILRR